MKNVSPLLMLGVPLVLSAACSDGSNNNSRPANRPNSTQTQPGDSDNTTITDENVAGHSRLQLAFKKLPALKEGAHYEAWGIINQKPYSAGKFMVNSRGQLMTLDQVNLSQGMLETDLDLTRASQIVITIEPKDDQDEAPSKTKVMAGEIQDGKAQMMLGDPAALASDFKQASGTFILATPTDGADTHETSGVWFLKNTNDQQSASLSLPQLPEGWVYEGWLVSKGQKLSTGRFTKADGSDMSAAFSGDQAAPAFPGEDFLMNSPGVLSFPGDLSQSKIVVTIEPDPDSDPAPSGLVILEGKIPANAEAMKDYVLKNKASALPTGNATILE